jgi:hypothetical protein
MSLTISAAMQNAMCNVLVDAVDAGAGFGYMQFRTGDPPATPETGNSGTLLVTHTFNKPAFTAAGASGFQPDGRAAMLGAGTPDTITNTGAAGHFRMFDSNNTCVLQGKAGTDLANPDVELQADLEVGTTDFEAGGTIVIQALYVLVAST